MSSFQVKQTVFRGILQSAAAPASEPGTGAAVPLVAHSEKPTYYTIVGQSRADLDDPENSPSVSMWPHLLLSAQSERLNEVSVYTERGASPSELRYLYFNDFALTLWEEMGKKAWILGRLYRPPRKSVLAFGVPFSE